MTKVSSLLIFLAIVQLGYSQKTLILQPDSVTGKDADVSSIYPNNNYGSIEKISPYAWTQGGVLNVTRSLIEFDLSSIPKNAVVSSATLDLTFNPHYPSPWDKHSGSNSFEIKRNTSAWVENSVTWNNKPTTTNIDMVVIPATTSIYQNFPGIDVTNMVNHMVQNPTDNFGFMMRLVTETPEKRVLLAASENRDKCRRPKLTITYTIKTSGIPTVSESNLLLVYPNPSEGLLSIRNAESEFAYLINISGGLVSTIKLTNGFATADVSSIPSGVYIVKSGAQLRRIVIK